MDIYESTERVEAYQLTPANADQLAQWCNGLKVEEISVSDPLYRYVGINVPGANHIERASEGDYIYYAKGKGFKVARRGEFENRFTRI